MQSRKLNRTESSTVIERKHEIHIPRLLNYCSRFLKRGPKGGRKEQSEQQNAEKTLSRKKKEEENKQQKAFYFAPMSGY
jgi:hypothetical protein